MGRDGEGGCVMLPIPGTPEWDHLWRDMFQRIPMPEAPAEEAEQCAP